MALAVCGARPEPVWHTTGNVCPATSVEAQRLSHLQHARFRSLPSGTMNERQSGGNGIMHPRVTKLITARGLIGRLALEIGSPKTGIGSRRQTRPTGHRMSLGSVSLSHHPSCSPTGDGLGWQLIWLRRNFVFWACDRWRPPPQPLSYHPRTSQHAPGLCQPEKRQQHQTQACIKPSTNQLSA